MPVATFDTLKFANTLKAAGVPSQQAEAEAAAFAEVIQVNFRELTSKDDLKATEKELRQEIAQLGKELRQEIAQLGKDLRQEMAELGKDLRQEIRGVEQQIKDVEQRLNSRLDLMAAENKAYQAALRGEFAALRGDMVLLKWMFGVGVTIAAGVAVRLFLFRGPV
jgi:chromosome segregation ATPase